MTTPFRPRPAAPGPDSYDPLMSGGPPTRDDDAFLDDVMSALPSPIEATDLGAEDREDGSGLVSEGEARGTREMRLQLDEEHPASANEIDSRDDDEADFEILDDEPEPGLTKEPDGEIDAVLMRGAIAALYGHDCPLAMEGDIKDADWVSWAEGLWARHRSGVERRLHMVKRNRLFRQGVQWVSSVGLGPWREPPKPRDAARAVVNMIGPALDQRVQIVAEQRPGFRARPASQDPEDMKKADAVQIALEYQYDQQNRAEVVRELEYWAGTDGVAFEELFWNPDRGPWHEFAGDAVGGRARPGADGAEPVGDVDSRVLRIEHVRVSANATATRKPSYWVIRETMPVSEAVARYGKDILTRDGEVTTESRSDEDMDDMQYQRLGALLPTPDELHRDQDTIDKYTIYCEPSEYLPKGLTLIVCGQKKCVLEPLLFGVVPMVRWTDGSTDPAFFCAPIMEQWIDAQMRVNALISKWIEAIRIGSGQRLLARTNAIGTETLLGGTVSIIDVKATGPISDSVQAITGARLSDDAVKLFEVEKKIFEDMSGWNDTTRGSYSADLSGRAILAIREQVERAFAPLVTAAARAQTDWARVSLAIMGWGYDVPRTAQVFGDSRVDLARELTREDFDGTADVWIDPETLMPMPRSLKLFLLKDMYQMGAMPLQEYRRRLPYASVRNLGTADEDHEARARRVAESLRQGQPPEPVLWMDNEAIHQDVLERELLLPDGIEDQVRAMAYDRWMQLAQQAQMKSMGMTMPPPGMGAGAPMAPPSGPMMLPPGAAGGTGTPPDRPPQGLRMPPTQQPFQGTNPSIPATTGSTGLGGEPDATSLAKAFDSFSTI